MVEHHINTKEDIERAVRKGINPGDIIVCESEMLQFVNEYMNQIESTKFFDDIFERSKNRELVCKSDPSGMTFQLPEKDMETLRESMKPRCKECGAKSNLIRPVDEDLPIYCKPCRNVKFKETDWISTKDRLPPDNVHVMAKNPFVVAESWIDGVDELGKPSWCHKGWEHADNFVTHWKPLESEEANE